MNTTDKYIKWNKDASIFFENAKDNSIILDVVISYANTSQTGEGFEEFVNSVNSENIRKKIKKLNIIDSSYLYRHTIQEFTQYSDINIQTQWFLNNKKNIEELRVNTSVKSWAEALSSSAFLSWHKQIKKDFIGDENGNGVIQDFRDTVLSESNEAALKGRGALQGCIEFILEECAYTCAFLRNTNLIYPARMSVAIMNCIERYNSDIFVLSYKTSKKSQNNGKQIFMNDDDIERAVTVFMKESVSNVNFFVIDRYGNHIYKNYSLDKIVGDTNAKRLSPESWRASCKVMQSRKQNMVEEKSLEGFHYLSVKSPLIINDTVEGVIGLSIDITDRKKAEHLEVESKLQKAVIEEQKAFKSLVEKLSHDVISPLQSLKRFRDTCSHLSAEEYATLNDISSKIETLSGAILNLHKKNYKFDYDLKERDILISLFLENMIVQKRYEYKDHNIEFKYLYDHKDNFIFIRGRQTDIGCMMSNLINNAVESFCGKDGIVEITLTADDDMVQIGVNDSGIGMPKETADKIIRGEPVHTTKATGHGIGTSQIRNTVVMYNGKMSIDSKEGIGTQITVVFPRSTKPHWIVDKITLRKGSIVVILDDDESSHQIWKDVLKNYDLKLQFFTKGDDAVNFINFSFEKDNIFFIADYNLREEYTGLVRVMEARKQKECIIATGFNTDWEVLDAIEKANVPMLPKQLLRYIPVVVD